MSLAEAFAAHRGDLWGAAYRMTGSAADADDVVQEVFTRALERPPDLQLPLRPWLMKVGMNAARDQLRRRKRRAYPGAWLPEPIEGPIELDAEARYSAAESVSFAFLLALEALSPKQRAVLILREVLDYSTEETAVALDIGAADVKVSLHRAKAAMARYDAERVEVARSAKNRAALEALMSGLFADDAAGLAALLAGEVVSRSDAGGVHRAALREVRGRDKVLRLLRSLTRKLGPVRSVEIREVNGLPAVLLTRDAADPKDAPRIMFAVDAGEDGRIRAVHFQLAPDKLGRLRFGGASDADPR